jgi:hypothetical protein
VFFVHGTTIYIGNIGNDLLAMVMSLINSCSVHYGTVQRSSGQPSILFNLFGATVERIYRPPMAILLYHGEVTHVYVLISQRSSYLEKFLSTMFPLGLVVTFQS